MTSNRAQKIESKERPIIFSGEMVRAILDGRKTQTRRIVKPQPKKLSGDAWEYEGEMFSYSDLMADHLFHNFYGDDKMPYGGVYVDDAGDRLWVRETWAPSFRKGEAQYKADLPAIIGTKIKQFDPGWESPLYMPRWASRILLEITDVRVERVQDINEEDVIKEGFSIHTLAGGNEKAYAHNFSLCWNFIHSDGAWERNDWVWVIEFRRVDA